MSLGSDSCADCSIDWQLSDSEVRRLADVTIFPRAGEDLKAGVPGDPVLTEKCENPVTPEVHLPAFCLLHPQQGGLPSQLWGPALDGLTL